MVLLGAAGPPERERRPGEPDHGERVLEGHRLGPGDTEFGGAEAGVGDEEDAGVLRRPRAAGDEDRLDHERVSTDGAFPLRRQNAIAGKAKALNF